MRQTALHQLIDMKLGQPLAEFIAERHRKYVPGAGWRQIAADLKDATGIDVSHETLRAWFADADDTAA